MNIMAIHAEAVEILVRKSHFEPEVALGIAEAIEVSITLAQLVTVPVLDARLKEFKTELRAELKELKAELTAETQSIRADMATLRQEMKTFQAEIRAELVAGLSSLSTEIQKINANLMRWVLLTSFGSVALSMAGRFIMKALGE